MCIHADTDYVNRLGSGDVITVYSTNYPAAYPTFKFACTAQFSTHEGHLQIHILESSIAVQDTIGIGVGKTQTFASTIYATNTGLRMPQRDNHPKGIYVLSTFLGSFMWIVFGAANAYRAKNYNQYSTINSGFQFRISVAEYLGEAFY